GVSIPAQIHGSVDGGRTWREIGGDVLTPDLGLRMGYGTVFLGVAGTRPETVYAAVVGRGIYRSSDGGANWSRLPLGQPGEYLRLTALLVDRVDPATLYAAFEDPRSGSSQGSGHVVVSHDGGATWRSRDDGLSLSSGGPWTLAVDSTGALFAANASASLQVSTEKQPWRSVMLHRFGGGFPQEGRVRFRPGDSSTVCTLLAGQPWKSADGGKSWAAFAVAPGSPFLNDLAIDAADPDVLYGAAETGVFRSGDGGESWTRLHAAAAKSLVLPRPGTILAGGCGIARSTDGGSTWREVLPCKGPSPSDLREVDRLRIHAAAPDNVLATVLGSFTQGVKPRSVYRSGDGGATWELVPGASVAVHDTHRPRTLYAVMGNDLAKSTDGGATWATVGSLSEVGELSDLVVDPAKPDTLYGVAYSTLSRSRDGGRTWERMPFQFHLVHGATLVPHPTVPHLFYVGGSNGIYEVRLEP
ncbi:MAG: WD40/YVTN/BNR-like repeat-containing protein, partial [Thermoanaerobaculia bacterium]